LSLILADTANAAPEPLATTGAPEHPEAAKEDGANAVDAVPPAGLLLPFAIQHVLVMYAGAVAVPLVVGRAMHLSIEHLAVLISADLVAAGLATLIQTLGLPGIGIRLPIMMGVTFASVSPLLALIEAAGPAPGAAMGLLPTIYGAVIVSGIFGFLIAPFVGRLTRFFPPTVTGTVILIIGLSLMRIAIDWAAGGQPSQPGYGAPLHLGIAFATLLIILGFMKYGRGLVRNGAVLLGVIAGAVLATALGETDFAPVASAPWFALVTPFQFGMPRFDMPISLAMCFVMIVTMIESFGMFLAAGTLVGRPATTTDLARGLRADALGTVIGGVFNTFPYTSYAQNIGLLSITGVRSRYVCAVGGVVLMMLGLCPKLAALVAALPVYVLGGAGFMMFGMIAATGIRILSSVELTQGRIATIAVSVAMGLIPVLSDKFFQAMPAALTPLLHSGIVLSSTTAILASLFFESQAEEAGEIHI